MLHLTVLHIARAWRKHVHLGQAESILGENEVKVSAWNYDGETYPQFPLYTSCPPLPSPLYLATIAS